MIDNPNIIIGVASGDTVDADTVFTCLLPLLRKSRVLDVWNARGNWSSDAHNTMIGHALELPKLDHLLFIDSDMLFPADSLERLLQRDVDVVGATYRRRKYPYDLIEAPLPGSPPINGIIGGAHAWEAIPAGLMLIDMWVLRAMSYPWFWDSHGESAKERVTPDINFGAKCRAHGFEVFCDYDLSRDVAHLAQVPIPFDLKM